MAEILKKNWFVVLIAVLLCGFAIYYVWDTTKDFVKGKSVDGKDVIASIDNYDLTADDLYGEIERFSVSQLYYRFRNAVIEQTVTEETDEMKENADKLKENLEAQAQSSSSYSADELISNMLESVGLESDELDRFCMLAQKESVMQRDYVEKNYDTLMKDVKNAHIISLIEISVSDADALSDDESETKEKIDAALKKGTAFADVAADYTQSTQTDENGLYGYVDSETEASSTLTDDMLKAALALKEGETSSWIKVSGDSGDKLVLIYADVVGKDNIKASKDSDVWSSLVSALISRNSTLSSEILFDAADQLEITFTDDTMLSRLRTYAGLDQ
ncbi:MAG: peptidylprolyl isomerase [Merdibacter sp.]|nr:peptidylprolyl isomerase [Merdibacter sp.]